jgi:predicted flap endonuclease-1-like 5' DNA nuclease
MVRVRYFVIGFLLGVLLAWYLEAESASTEELPEAIPPSAASRPVAPKKQSPKDPLTEIEGIGPAYERALNALGIFTFAQLAEQTAESLASNMTARVTAERIQREKWIEQAKSRSR